MENRQIFSSAARVRKAHINIHESLRLTNAVIIQPFRPNSQHFSKVNKFLHHEISTHKPST